MPKILYVDPDEDVGSDANSGLSEKRAKRTLAGALAADLRPGDRVRVRMGSRFTTPQTLKVNGVAFDTYTMGTEADRAPLFQIPKVAGVPNGTAITIQGSDNSITGWDVRDADMGVLVDAGIKIGSAFVSYSGNRLEDMRIRNFAQAVMIRGSKTEVTDVSVFHGRMLRNTAVTYVGANGFTVWKSEFYPNVGTRLVRCYAEDCYAFTPASGEPDGAPVEIFGGVEDLTVSWMVARNSATFCEIGMTPSRHETVRTVRFEHCLSVDSNGRVLYVNDRNGTFGGDIEGIVFSKCTFKANDDNATPFFIGEGHGNLADKLRVEQSIIVAGAQVYNAAAGTDWRSISRADNVYWRPGNKNAGVPLVNGDVYADPPFHNPSAGDYRLIYGHPRGATLGALGTGPSLEETYHPKPSIVNDDDSIRGGHHTVARYLNMVQIADRYRSPGMLCTVDSHRATYRLQRDRVTWLRVTE